MKAKIGLVLRQVLFCVSQGSEHWYTDCCVLRDCCAAGVRTDSFQWNNSNAEQTFVITELLNVLCLTCCTTVTVWLLLNILTLAYDLGSFSDFACYISPD
jgi:hypothetical protein